MKRVAVILAEGFEESEALVPVDILRRAGLTVDILGLSAVVKGSHDICVTVDALLSHKMTQRYHAIVLPGGSLGARNLAASELVQELIKSAVEQDVLVAAICAAPSLILADKGFLEGVRYTGFPSETLPHKKGIYLEDRNMVLDGNFLTAKSMAYSIDFGLALVSFLESPIKAFKIAKEVCYEDWDLRYKNFYHSFFSSNQDLNSL